VIRSVRAAAHVHSDWSDDGSRSLADIARTFAWLGCDVVLMSEHSRGFTAAKWDEYAAACQQASTGRLLLVPGIEYGDDDDTVHTPVWGPVPFLGDRRPTGELLAAAHAAGGVAMWAHPWRRDAWRRFDPGWLGYLAAVEVWNRKYDGIAPNRDATALAARTGLRPAVALDFHTRRQLFPLTLRLDLDGGLSRPAVWAALAGGRFTARALGLPVGTLTHGPGGAALRGLDRARRAAVRRAAVRRAAGRAPR